MSETWTEYAWQDADGSISPVTPSENRGNLKYASNWLLEGERVVGRTVTASDWLPVDGAQ